MTTSIKKDWYKSNLDNFLNLNKKFKKYTIAYTIKILESHIEHPTKPGYKRHDILLRIEELKKELDE